MAVIKLDPEKKKIAAGRNPAAFSARKGRVNQCFSGGKLLGIHFS